MNLWNYFHYTLGLHFWVIPAVIVIAVTAVAVAVHIHLKKKRCAEHEFSYSMKYGTAEKNWEEKP